MSEARESGLCSTLENEIALHPLLREHVLDLGDGHDERVDAEMVVEVTADEPVVTALDTYPHALRLQRTLMLRLCLRIPPFGLRRWPSYQRETPAFAPRSKPSDGPVQ